MIDPILQLRRLRPRAVGYLGQDQQLVSSRARIKTQTTEFLSIHTKHLSSIASLMIISPVLGLRNQGQKKSQTE